jgi:hypothetical protein
LSAGYIRRRYSYETIFPPFACSTSFGLENQHLPPINVKKEGFLQNRLFFAGYPSLPVYMQMQLLATAINSTQVYTNRKYS